MIHESMIVAPQPEAAEAGALVLRKGGNAVDAAIACALVQTVVDPLMCGVAGFGSIQIFDGSTGRHIIIDAHARCPAATRPDMWQDLILGETRDGFGFILRDYVNERGYQAVAASGILQAFSETVAEFGTMPWSEIVAPAVAEAERGFVVRPHVHTVWTQNERQFGRLNYGDKLGVSETGREIYFQPDGTYKTVGQKVVNPDMARSLGRIASEGAETFTSGSMAEEIEADFRANGGLLRASDLSAYRTERPEPLWGEYRGCRIATNPPPGGGILLLEILHILESFDVAGMGHNSAAHIAVLAEAMKCATRDKDQYVSDPRFVDVPVERLTSKAYARERAGEIARGERFSVPRLNAEPAHTTHVSCVDANGTLVSLTHSLGIPSGVITRGHGFMHNGCMSVFDPRPGRTGSLAPGKSRFASMSPTLLFRDGRPMMSIGAPGGTHIPLAVAQAISNVIDFGMSMAEAVAAPRISATSDVVDVSNRIPRYVTDELEAKGYRIARSPLSYAFAGVHGILIDEQGRLSGGADPQRDGMALSIPSRSSP
jgi:gamma-glutamyltranspeptidase/glutathione hydrolase